MKSKEVLMKSIEKLFLSLLVSSMLIVNIFCVTSYATTQQEESTAHSVTQSDVIAGLTVPSQLGNFSAQDAMSTPIIEYGTYYLNNIYCGDYLKYDSSTVTTESGKYSRLGPYIRWIIQEVNGSYVIRCSFNSSMCLSVSTSSAAVELRSVSGTTIPTECLWNISVASSGGCLIKSVYNSQYLYSYGNSVYTTNTLPDSSSMYYDTCAWRIADLSVLGGKELTDDTVFHQRDLLYGYADIIKYRKDPEDAIWSSASDFQYSNYNQNIITISRDGTITPVSVGQTNVICKHKPTDITFTVDVIVYPIQEYLGPVSSWADVESNFVGHWLYDPSVYYINLSNDESFYFEEGIVEGISKWNTALETNVSTVQSSSNADIIVVGGSTDDFREAFQWYIPDGTLGYTEWGFAYLGHYTSNTYNSPVKLDAAMLDATVLILQCPGRTNNEYVNACTHELGHALGFFGHTSSSTAIMYSHGHSGVTLARSEINHLAQVYH